MHDLRLVGVHEDGEHLLLSNAEGERFLLTVDDALRAAVRRDRPHLGQLQIEIEGGLRPRDVQARIRAGATADEVAALAGWPVEKVRRYEGPILAEREHVAGLAREVRLRRRGGSVTLGAEVARRLTARGVDPDQVRWDSWRVEGDPWTIVVTFPAGGRERSARWHLDLAGRSVTPGDDEARWLSEDQPEGEGPLAGARLSAVSLSPSSTPGSSGHVYDVEVDGGIGASDTGTWSSTSGEALDLVGAMRARRQAGRGSRRRPASHGSTAGAPHDEHGEAMSTGVHPAGRRRNPVAAPEPLELDPSLMDDPPAAHPPAGAAPGQRGHEDRLGSVGQASSVTALPTPSPTGPPTSPFGLPVAAAEAAPPATSPSTPQPSGAHHWPLADAMRHAKAPVADAPSEPAAPAEPESTTPDSAHRSRSADEVELRDREPETASRPATGRRTKRPSVPSWDDIMFGAKQD
jgi:hypothetical protein